MRKIADFTQDEGLDLFVMLTAPTAALARNAALKDALMGLAKRYADGAKEDDTGEAEKLIPVLLKECRPVVKEILAIIGGYTEEQINALGAGEFYKEMLVWMMDKDYWTFFSSFVEMTPAE